MVGSRVGLLGGVLHGRTAGVTTRLPAGSAMCAWPDPGAVQATCQPFSGFAKPEEASWTLQLPHQEWVERWKGKTLRLKNPRTGSTMEAEARLRGPSGLELLAGWNEGCSPA